MLSRVYTIPRFNARNTIRRQRCCAPQRNASQLQCVLLAPTTTTLTDDYVIRYKCQRGDEFYVYFLTRKLKEQQKCSKL